MSSLLLSQVDIVARGEPQSTSWASDKDLWKSMNTSTFTFTIVVLDEEDIECEMSSKIKHFHEVPGWRNWQTQRTQNPPTFGSWGFDSPSRHHLKTQRINGQVINSRHAIQLRKQTQRTLRQRALNPSN